VQEPTLEDEVAGAQAYESLHVPALFKQWCPRVLDAAGVGPGHDVLDVACGTGVLAREAAVRVGPEGFVAGVDPGRGMLAVANGPRRSSGTRERRSHFLIRTDGLMLLSASSV